MTEDQIKYMVDRFLGWKLPENFNPDAGISFKATFNEHTAYQGKHRPSGTNVFDATQADAMVRYMIEGMPAGAKRLREALEFIADGYANQDVSHVDFRVKAYQVALDALDSALPLQNGKTP